MIDAGAFNIFDSLQNAHTEIHTFLDRYFLPDSLTEKGSLFRESGKYVSAQPLWSLSLYDIEEHAHHLVARRFLQPPGVVHCSFTNDE